MVTFSLVPAIAKINGSEHDALACLTRYHSVLRRLFRYYEHLVVHGGNKLKKEEVAGQICFKWCIHTQIEEELLYPIARKLMGEKFRLQHSLDDHSGSRELVAMLDKIPPGDANFDPTVAMLAAYVSPHMDEEEQVLFPQ